MKIQQREYTKWVLSKHWNSPISITLMHRCGSIGTTTTACSANLKHFLNVVNKTIFGNKVRRGFKVQAVPTLEEFDGKPHYHLMMDCPEHITKEALFALINQEWPRTNLGHPDIRINENASEGWVKYIFKQRTKPEFDTAIDVANMHFNNFVAEAKNPH